MLGAFQGLQTGQEGEFNLIDFSLEAGREMFGEPVYEIMALGMRAGDHKQKCRGQNHQASQRDKMPGLEIVRYHHKKGYYEKNAYKRQPVKQDFQHGGGKDRGFLDMCSFTQQKDPGHLPGKVRHQQIGHNPDAVYGENHPYPGGFKSVDEKCKSGSPDKSDYNLDKQKRDKISYIDGGDGLQDGVKVKVIETKDQKTYCYQKPPEPLSL